MKTIYKVATRYFDRFAGMPMLPGYSIVASDARRTVRFLNAVGSDLTNELLPPTDDDFAFVTGELDRLVEGGTLTIEPKGSPGPAPKPPEPEKTPEPPKQEVSPKADQKTDATKKTGK